MNDRQRAETIELTATTLAAYADGKITLAEGAAIFEQAIDLVEMTPRQKLIAKRLTLAVAEHVKSNDLERALVMFIKPQAFERMYPD